MVLEKKAFTPYKLEEERNKDEKVHAVRLNAAEQELIEHIMRDLDIKSAGMAMKMSLEPYLNVIHSTFGCDKIKYLMRRDRARASDYTRVKIGGMR